MPDGGLNSINLEILANAERAKTSISGLTRELKEALATAQKLQQAINKTGEPMSARKHGKIVANRQISYEQQVSRLAERVRADIFRQLEKDILSERVLLKEDAVRRTRERAQPQNRAARQALDAGADRSAQLRAQGEHIEAGYRQLAYNLDQLVKNTTTAVQRTNSRLSELQRQIRAMRARTDNINAALAEEGFRLREQRKNTTPHRIEIRERKGDHGRAKDDMFYVPSVMEADLARHKFNTNELKKDWSDLQIAAKKGLGNLHRMQEIISGDAKQTAAALEQFKFNAETIRRKSTPEQLASQGILRDIHLAQRLIYGTPEQAQAQLRFDRYRADENLRNRTPEMLTADAFLEDERRKNKLRKVERAETRAALKSYNEALDDYRALPENIAAKTKQFTSSMTQLRTKQQTTVAGMSYDEAMNINARRSAEDAIHLARRGRAAASMDFSRERLGVDGGAGIFAIQGRLLANYAVMGAGIGSVGFLLRNVVQLQKEFRQFQAITATTDSEMKMFEQTLIGVSEKTKFTALEVAKAATIMGQAGLSARQVADAIEPVTLLATAAGTDLANAVDVVTSTLSVFDMQAGKTGEVANVLTAALNQSKLTIDKIALGIQYSGNIAATAGVEFKELTAVLGALANSGIKSGSTIGTGLRQLLIDIQDPSEKFKKKLESLGLTTEDVNIQTQSFVGVLKNLREAGFSGSDALEVFEVRAAAAFNAIANNIHHVERLQQNFINTNAATKANEVQMRSLANTWQKFQSVAVTAAARGLTPLVELLQVLVDKFANLLSVVKNIPGAFAVLGTAVGALLVGRGLSFLFNLVGGLTGRFAGLRAEMAKVSRASSMLGAAGGLAMAGRVGVGLLGGPVGAVTTAAIIGITVAMQGLGAASRTAAQRLDEAQGKLNKLTGQTDDTKTGIRSVQEEIERLIRQADMLNKDPMQRRMRLLEAKNAFGELGLEIGMSIEKIEELIEAYQNLEQTMKRRLSGELKLVIDQLDEVIRSSDKVLKGEHEENTRELRKFAAVSLAPDMDELRQMLTPGGLAEFFKQRFHTPAIGQAAGLLTGVDKENSAEIGFLIGQLGELREQSGDTIKALIDSMIEGLRRLNMAQKEVERNLEKRDEYRQQEINVDFQRDPKVDSLKRDIEQQTKIFFHRRGEIQRSKLAPEEMNRQIAELDAEVDSYVKAKTEELKAITEEFAATSIDPKIARSTQEYVRRQRELVTEGLSGRELQQALEDIEKEIIQGKAEMARDASELTIAINKLDALAGNALKVNSEEAQKVFKAIASRRTRNISKQLQLEIKKLNDAQDEAETEGIRGRIEAYFSELRKITEELHRIERNAEGDNPELQNRQAEELETLAQQQAEALSKVTDRQVEIVEEANKRYVKTIDAEIDKTKQEIKALETKIETTTSAKLDELLAQINALIEKWTGLISTKQQAIQNTALTTAQIQQGVARTGAIEPGTGLRATPVSAASGNYTISPNVGAARYDPVDAKLRQIIEETAARLNVKVEVISGYRAGDPRYHGKGQALDISLFGPDGKPLPNYQDATAFREYEKFAQAARLVQQELYPELSNNFRWGGYFSGPPGKYGAVDTMHFDLGRSMAGGSWEHGLTDAQRQLFPGAVSVGMSQQTQDAILASRADAAADTTAAQTQQQEIIKSATDEMNKRVTSVISTQISSIGRQVERIMSDTEVMTNPADIQNAMAEVQQLSAESLKKQIDEFKQSIPTERLDNPDIQAKISEIEQSEQQALNSRLAQLYQRYIDAQKKLFEKPVEAAQAKADAAQLPSNEGKVSSAQVEQFQQQAALAQQMATQQQLNFLKSEELRLTQAIAQAAGTSQELQLKEQLKVVQAELNQMKSQELALNQQNAAANQNMGAIMSAGTAQFFKNQGYFLNTATNQWQMSADQISQNWTGMLDTISSSFSNAISGIVSGTMSAKDAFRQMALSILNYLIQMISKMLVMQVMTAALGKTAGGATGGGGGGGLLGGLFGGGGGGGGLLGGLFGKLFGAVQGGLVPQRMAHGGFPARDSVPALLEPGEFVLRKSAVDMVGADNLKSINAAGNRRLGEAPSMPHQEREKERPPINIWVAERDQIPPPGPNDVVVWVGDNMRRHGELRTLVKAVSSGAM